MDIRTKLVFALVSVSLASMLALGAFTYGAVRELLQGIAVRQLEAVAETKKQDLERVVAAWRDRVRLITSRTKFRDSLAELSTKGPDAKTEALIRRILGDALDAVQSLRGITVFHTDGRKVAQLGLDPARALELHPARFQYGESPVVFEGVFLDPEGSLTVAFATPVQLNERVIGHAKVLLSAQELIDVTDDYTGLGETGETLLAMRTEQGGALILNPLRHDREAMLRRTIPPDREQDPTIAAVKGGESVFRDDALDYRGREVWAATRHLDGLDWGIVVKVDAAEEAEPVLSLRSTMWKLAVSVSAFAVLAGVGLGLYFARPIHQLAEVARRIRAGELDLRARTDSEDEVGLLARTFNEMTEELIEKNRELERRMGSRPP